jgi:hypothetical protein
MPAPDGPFGIDHFTSSAECDQRNNGGSARVIPDRRCDLQ